LRRSQAIIESPLTHGLVLFALLWLPTLWLPFGRDQGLWAAIADQVNRGGAVYADGITLKPPGITYLYSWALALWRDMRAIRILDLVWLSGTLVFMILLVPRPGRRLLGPLLGLLFGITHFFVFTYWEMAGPDVWIGLPVVAAVWMHRAEWPGYTLARRLLLGALFAGAFWLKYPALLLIGILPALDLWGPSSLRPRSIGTFARAWGLTGLGFLLGIGTVLMEVTSSGAFEAFREVQIDYLLGYAGYRLESGTAELQWSRFNPLFALHSVQAFFLAVPFLLLPALLVAPCWPSARERGLWPYWLAALLALGATVAQKKFFLAHYGPMIPWLCLLAGFGIERAARWIAERIEMEERWRPTLMLALAVGMTSCLLPLSDDLHVRMPQLSAWMQQIGGDPEDRRAFYDHFGPYGAGDFSFLADAEVAHHLRRTTDPDDAVFVWGFEPLVYFLADRPPASRFMASTTLTNPASNPAWRDELFARAPARGLHHALQRRSRMVDRRRR
jgi:hypothetical protein